MKDTVDRIVGVCDENGIIISCSELNMIGETRQGIKDEILYASGTVRNEGYTYRRIGAPNKSDYAVFVQGEDKEAEKLCGVLAITLGGMKDLYDEKYDKSSFIKNIILDNILPSDIYTKAHELHFTTDVTRVVFLIRFENVNGIVPFEIVENMFPDRNHDYVIAVSELEILLVTETEKHPDAKNLEQTAMQISDTISTEFFAKVFIGIGTPVDNLRDLARSYKESQIAIEVGKVFDTEKRILSYENLGIGRLIYQLPTTLCEVFLSEVFKKGTLEAIDHETLMTVQGLFENNLNVSETARKMFVHRNTLVYRLDKVMKITGLDLREFDHAVTFKVALMVHKYLQAKPVKF